MPRFFVLAGALLLYGTLALQGIHYGLPHGARLLSYNTDETTWLEALGRIKPSEKRFNPHPQLPHPTFYLEAYGAAMLAGAATGWVPFRADKEWLRQHPDQFARFYLVGRYLQVLFGILLVISFWWVVGRAFGRLAANIATPLLAVTPSLISASHFSQASLPVTALTFWSLGCLWMGWLPVGAFLGGLAVATKYSAAPLILPIFYAALRKPPRPRNLGLIIIGLVGGFVVGCPFAVLAPKDFWVGFIHHTTENVETASGVLPFIRAFRYALGDVLAIACLAAWVWMIRKKGKDLVLWLWTVPFLVGVLAVGYVASSARVLIGVPALLIGVGVYFSDLITTRRCAPGVVYVLVAVVFLGTLLPSLALVDFRNQVPLQQQVSYWIQANVALKQTIAIPRPIYWWTPDVIYESVAHPERMRAPYRVKTLHFSKNAAMKMKPEYILVSDYERQRCHGWANYSASCQEFFTWMDSGQLYSVFRRFPRTVQWKNWRWNRPEWPMSFDDDLWATSLTLYERRSAS